jgi:ankyrin repeat protein
MKTDELIHAIQKGDSKAVAALLDEDRALLKAKEGQVSAVLLSLYHGHPEIPQLFTDRGAELTFAEACAAGDRKRAAELLDHDPALARSFSEDGYPAAGLAIFFRHPELARDLIERGADVNAAAKNPQRVALLHSAAAVGDGETMRVLLQRGADPNVRQQSGFTALHNAANRGDIEMAKLLLEFHADPEARTDDGKDVVDIAEQYNQPAFVEWFRANSG